MKKTKAVTLIIIASVTLTACGSDGGDTYRSQKDCQKAWSNSPELCQPTGSAVGTYRGPMMYSQGGSPHYYNQAGQLVRAPASYRSVAPVVRGSFGSIGRSFSVST